MDVQAQGREVKRNVELKATLVKSSSRLPLSASSLKRGPDQMEDALEPAKKRTRVMGAVTKVDTSRPRGPRLSTVSQTQGHTAAQKGPKKTGPRGCSTVGAGNTALDARVLELEESLGTRERLLQDLQRERLQLQEERSTLSTQLEEQERRFQVTEAALSSSQEEVVCLRQKTEAQVTLLAEQGDRLYELEMERRRLHNQLQELKGNIRVFCRVRPVLTGESTPSPGFLVFPPGPAGPSDPPTGLSLSRSDDRRSTLTGAPAPTLRHDFSFDRVFPPGSKQEEVFEEIAMLVQSALDGYPVCIFAYGQTGSGKTFTMEGGPRGDPQLEGLIPRAMRHLFSVAQEMSGQGWTYSFVASYVEIYNETVRDLLATGPRKGQGGECEIRRASPGSEELTVTNARYVPVSCEKEGLQCGAPLNLVDLAGSERLDPGLPLGPGERDRLRETQAINSSLSTLGLVIMALSNKESHVPYRNSKLTYLLQNSLGGSAKMLMFVNISPLEENVSESLNSLRFASKVNQCVIGTAQANKK
ncbi:kinesin-like protein KIFC1 [Mus caroli]|uniref:Kinesin-like protein n=1 Tax=Mus caroli TaxID=10089 RepID=A0A6P7QFF5_MUSCR|nr:kinesin-like protein KIFC1 [Mus caroli]